MPSPTIQGCGLGVVFQQPASLLLVAIGLLAENIREGNSEQPLIVTIGTADPGAKNAEILQLRTQLRQLSAKRDYAPIRKRLGLFVDEGSKIRDGVCSNFSPECDRTRHSWESRVSHYLLTELDSSYASTFRTTITTYIPPTLAIRAEIQSLLNIIAELK